MMSYVDGFVLAVPHDRKDDYVRLSHEVWERHFRPGGALTQVECWEDDVPEGVVTSFPMAVQRKPGEAVVFAWIEWPDRATRDACYSALPEAGVVDNPFDAQRMIFGGFVPVARLAAGDA